MKVMKRKTITATLQIVLIFAEGISVPQLSKSGILSTCSKRILLQYQQPNEKKVISINNHIDHIPIPSMNFNLEYELTMKTEVGKPADIYLLKIENNTEEIFSKLSEATIWNPRGKFIIFTSGIQTNFLQILNKYFVDRVAILIFNKADRKVYIYDYKIVDGFIPRKYKIGSCTEDVSTLPADLFSRENKKRKFSMLNIFVSRMPPFYIDKSLGLNFNIIETISSHLGLEMNETLLELDNYERNEKIFSILKSYQFDMFGGFTFANKYEYYYFDVTYPALLDKCAFAVPVLTRTEASSENLLDEFSFSVWLIYISSLSVFPLIFYVSNICSKDEAFEQRYSLFMLTLEVVFQNCTKFKPKGVVRRFSLVTLLLLAMVMSTSYKSKLFSTLTDKKLIQILNNFENVMELNMSVAMEQQTQIESLDDLNYGEYIKSHVFQCEDLVVCLNRTSLQKDFVTMGSLRQFQWFIPRMENGSNVRILPTFYLKWQSLSFFFIKGHPLLDKFNTQLILLKEFGFIKKWYYDIISINKTFLLENETVAIKLIALKNLKYLFIMYGVGNLIALTVFFLEYMNFI